MKEYLIRAVYFPIVCRLILHFHSVALAVLVMTRSFVLTWLLYDASSLNEPIEESVRWEYWKIQCTNATKWEPSRKIIIFFKSWWLHRSFLRPVLDYTAVCVYIHFLSFFLFFSLQFYWGIGYYRCRRLYLSTGRAIVVASLCFVLRIATVISHFAIFYRPNCMRNVAVRLRYRLVQ